MARGGRTQQGRTPAPGQHAPGQVRPAQSGPPPAPEAVPRRGGRTQQGARQQARKGGRTQQGTGAGQEVPPAAPQQAQQPPEPAQRPAASRVSVATTEGSGAFLVLFAYPLAFNLVRGGPAGMKAWVKAKFINQPQAADVMAGTQAAPAPRPAQPGPAPRPGHPNVGAP